MKVQINFWGIYGYKTPLECEAESLKSALEKYAADRQDLEGANLEGAYLRGANLGGANLRGANLEGANLRGANLGGANLEGANLEGANLRGANLEGANLEGANLEGANLGGANLRGANLEGANLRGAKYGDKELWSERPVLILGPCGSVGRYTCVYFFEDKSEPVIKCGCFTGNIDEFEAQIHETHEGSFFEAEYMVMVGHIQALRKIQLEEKAEQNG